MLAYLEQVRYCLPQRRIARIDNCGCPFHSLSITATCAFSEGQNSTITGRIDSLFKQISHGYLATFVVHQINDREIPYFLQPKVRIVWSQTENRPEINDELTLEVVIKPVYGRLNEAGF
jgi:hypothetical protein